MKIEILERRVHVKYSHVAVITEANEVNEKSKKIAFGNKEHQNHENRRLVLIESLHMQHCSKDVNNTRICNLFSA